MYFIVPFQSEVDQISLFLSFAIGQEYSSSKGKARTFFKIRKLGLEGNSTIKVGKLVHKRIFSLVNPLLDHDQLLRTTRFLYCIS